MASWSPDLTEPVPHTVMSWVGQRIFDLLVMAGCMIARGDDDAGEDAIRDARAISGEFNLAPKLYDAILGEALKEVR